MFIGIFSYGTWVLTGVVEEKQSRVVEVVLSTVRPRNLLIGKVLGIGILALAQLAVLVVAGLIAVQISGRLTLPPTTIGAVVQLLTWFILGFALYSTTMGFLGSLASRVEDASNASLPVTMTATACYLASILLVTQDPDGLLARVHDVLPAGRADGRPAADRARRDRAVGDGALDRADGGVDLDPVRGRRAGLRGCRAPGGRPDEAPRRLARAQLTAPYRGQAPAWISAHRGQVTSWSLTRPADCISA